MDWLKIHYDKVILLVAAIVTIWLGITLILKANSFRDNFALKAATPTKILPETLEADVVVATDTLGVPSIWGPPNIGGKKPALFLSVPIVEKDGKIFNLSEEDPPLRPPLSNEWLMANQLDFLRPDVYDLDPDKDGFSNLKEWEAEPKTNPKDPKSHPSFLLKLALLARTQTDYFVTFKADNNPDFQVEWAPPGARAQTKFLKKGDRFGEGDRFVITGYEAKDAMVNNIRRNVSELKVTDVGSGTPLVLVLGQKLNLPTYFADFRFDLGQPADFKVKQGDSFKLPSGGDTTYKLIDVQEDSATIESVPPAGSPDLPVKTVVPKAGAPQA